MIKITGSINTSHSKDSSVCHSLQWVFTDPDIVLTPNSGVHIVYEKETA